MGSGTESGSGVYHAVRCRMARAAGVPSGPTVRPCPPAQATVPAGGLSRYVAPIDQEGGQQMAEHNGLDGKLMTRGRRRRALRARRLPRSLVGGFTINRNPMALVYEIARRRVKDLHLVAHSNGQAARRARRRRLREPRRDRLRRQRPLRAHLHPLPQGGRARRGAGGGLHQQPDEPALPGRRPERAVHPQQVGPRARTCVDKQGFPPELRCEDGVACEKVDRHRRPLRPRRRRGGAAAGAHAGRVRDPRAAGGHRRHRAHQGPHLRRPRAVQGGVGRHRDLRGDRAARATCGSTPTRTRCRPSWWTPSCRSPTGPIPRPAATSTTTTPRT